MLVSIMIPAFQYNATPSARLSYWWSQVLTPADRERYRALGRHDELQKSKQRAALKAAKGEA